MTSRSSSLPAAALLLGAWGLAFSLACHLTSSSPPEGNEAGLADMLMGESRQALSLNFFNEADLYFHKGVGHIQPKFNLHSPFQKWERDITPEQHAHAEGAASAEILPWLKLATGADPHNVEAFLVAAFWAVSGLHRQDMADAILAEAQRLNPGDYRIPLEKGRMAIRAGKLEAAYITLEAALRLQPRVEDRKEMDRQLALDRAETLVFLGFLAEIKGSKSEAIRMFRNALAIFPERTYIRDRMALLETGKEPPDSAQSLLKQLTRQTVDDACHDEHDHHHDD